VTAVAVGEREKVRVVMVRSRRAARGTGAARGGFQAGETGRGAARGGVAKGGGKRADKREKLDGRNISGRNPSGGLLIFIWWDGLRLLLTHGEMESRLLPTHGAILYLKIISDTSSIVK
jgi:hypothetical protein